MKSLAFHPMFSTEVVEEDKWLTVRWPPEEKEYGEGDDILLVTSEGMPLAEAVILSTNEVELQEFAGQKVAGHAEYGNWESMHSSLSIFYDQVPYEPEEEVLVIAWKITEVRCRIPLSCGGEIRFA